MYWKLSAGTLCVLRSLESIPAFCRWHAPHIEMHPTTHAHNHTINGRDMVSDNGHYTRSVESTLRTRAKAERRHHYHYHCIGETNISTWFGCDHVHAAQLQTFIFNIVHPRIFKWIVLYANIVVLVVCHAQTTLEYEKKMDNTRYVSFSSTSRQIGAVDDDNNNTADKVWNIWSPTTKCVLGGSSLNIKQPHGCWFLFEAEELGHSQDVLGPGPCTIEWMRLNFSSDFE